MELTEGERAVAKELWEDELNRNVIEKMMTIAAGSVPDLSVMSLMQVFYAVGSLVEEDVINNK